MRSSPKFSSSIIAASFGAAAACLASCGGASGTSTPSASINATPTVTATQTTSSSSASSSSSSSSSTTSSSATASGAAGATTSAIPSGLVPTGYQLVWSDEFNGTGLPDATKWGDDAWANIYDPANGEKQYYTAQRLLNEHQEGGALFITVRKEDMVGAPNYANQHYSSARIRTAYKADWTYGYFEIRAKLPCGAGTWPAIWLLGSGNRWPADGEIDIMEQLGREPNKIYGTIHDTYNQPHNGDGGYKWINDACGSFHIYQLTWTADRLDIGIDGTTFYSYYNAHTGYDQWPFTGKQFLILNVAMGGGWAGAIDDTALPRSMLVDYVRVYQKN